LSAEEVSKLIADGDMIMATKLLNKRIKDIMAARQREDNVDIASTQNDLEHTRKVFDDSNFKPFSAVGYEYNKVRVRRSPIGFGKTVKFNYK